MCKSKYDKQISEGKILVQKIKAKAVKYISLRKCGNKTYVDLKQTIKNYTDIVIDNNNDNYSVRTVGYYVGTIRDNKIVVRNSFCSPEDFKKFCAVYGKDLACAKLFVDDGIDTEMAGSENEQTSKVIDAGTGFCYIMPYTLEEVKDYFTKRCLRYFKGHDFEGFCEPITNEK